MRRSNSISSLVVGEQLQFSSRRPPIEETLLLEYIIRLLNYWSHGNSSGTKKKKTSAVGSRYQMTGEKTGNRAVFAVVSCSICEFAIAP
jgi:hypothetical protein